MPVKFDPLPLPKFDISLLNYLNQSFERIRQAFRSVNAELNVSPDAEQVLTAQAQAAANAWGDLATIGPIVTVKTGARAIVMLSAQQLPAGGGDCRMGYAVTGASTLAQADDYAMISFAANQTVNAVLLDPRLTPGVNTFTAKYLNTGGGSTWLRRRLAVIPIK